MIHDSWDLFIRYAMITVIIICVKRRNTKLRNYLLDCRVFDYTVIAKNPGHACVEKRRKRHNVILKQSDHKGLGQSPRLGDRSPRLGAIELFDLQMKRIRLLWWNTTRIRHDLDNYTIWQKLQNAYNSICLWDSSSRALPKQWFLFFSAYFKVLSLERTETNQ